MQNRLQTNTQFIKHSLNIIALHKQFLILPVINLVIRIGLFALIFTPLLKFEKSLWISNTLPSGKTIFIFFIVFLIYLTISTFISLLFHAALSAYATNYMTNTPCTMGHAFLLALKNTKQLYYYKIIADTLIPAIRLLDYWMDNWPATAFAKNILAGLRVRVAVYLVIPILSNEKISAWKAVKRSAYLIKNTWGDALRPRMTANATVIWLHVLSLIPAFIAIGIGGKIIIIIGSVISVILFLCIATLYATAHIILSSALYLFAIGNKNTARFYADSLLENAFQSIKNSKN